MRGCRGSGDSRGRRDLPVRRGISDQFPAPLGALGGGVGDGGDLGGRGVSGRQGEHHGDKLGLAAAAGFAAGAGEVGAQGLERHPALAGVLGAWWCVCRLRLRWRKGVSPLATARLARRSLGKMAPTELPPWVPLRAGMVGVSFVQAL